MPVAPATYWIIVAVIGVTPLHSAELVEFPTHYEVEGECIKAGDELLDLVKIGLEVKYGEAVLVRGKCIEREATVEDH